jgi:hypothetical protein
MTSLRIVGDAIEIDGVTIARLLPGLRLSFRDKLTEAFGALDEDAETIARLEDRIAWLGKPLGHLCAEGAPVKGRASTRYSCSGRSSGALEVGGWSPRPKRPSWSVLEAFVAGALMLATPAWADRMPESDPAITPGAVRTTDVGAICSTGARQLRH